MWPGWYILFIFLRLFSYFFIFLGLLINWQMFVYIWIIHNFASLAKGNFCVAIPNRATGKSWTATLYLNLKYICECSNLTLEVVYKFFPDMMVSSSMALCWNCIDDLHHVLQIFNWILFQLINYWEMLTSWWSTHPMLTIFSLCTLCVGLILMQSLYRCKSSFVLTCTFNLSCLFKDILPSVSFLHWQKRKWKTINKCQRW